MKAFILTLLMASSANAELVPNFVIKHEEPVMTSGRPAWKEIRSKDNKCGLLRNTNISPDWQYVTVLTSDASLHMTYQQVENDLSIYTVNYGYDRCDVTRKSDKVLSVMCKSGLFKKTVVHNISQY